MKKRRWWNPRLNLVSLCVVMWLSHAILKYALAQSDIASRVFAYGEHVPLWMALITALFVLIRLFVIIMIPGLLVFHATLAASKIFNKGESAGEDVLVQREMNKRL